MEKDLQVVLLVKKAKCRYIRNKLYKKKSGGGGDKTAFIAAGITQKILEGYISN